MSADEPPNTSAEHANRNRIQLEMLKVAVARQKHAAYIDAMLERRTPGEPAATPGHMDADKKGADS
jgi:hypothetical protein